ncbi:hypothetical protein HYU07_03140 [Candidatus Woesearchaeota archaeon]|nr:hypothetical protein [Candidatus Woesearchaeota archaeon]
MKDQLVEKLSDRMSKLKTYDRSRFLQGAYKQLTISHKGRQTNGEYRTAVDNLHYESEDRIGFMLNFIDALKQYGLPNHAQRLLNQERLNETYENWKHTIRELQRVDPNWAEYAVLHPQWGGVQLDVGGYRECSPFSTSIVLRDGSYGGDYKLYEALPLFDGIGLQEKGNSDDVLGWLSLDDALNLGKATASRDPKRFESVLERVM